MSNNRIILPSETMRIKANPRQPVPEVQVPIFPIPVRSNESFMMYALCLHAIETGMYDEMPLISPHLKAMKDGLEMSYQKLGIPMFEYRKFVVMMPPDEGENDKEEGCDTKVTQPKGEEQDVEMGTEEKRE